MMNREALSVVLLSPRNPLNIGAAARAMSNFGFPHLRIVNAYEVAYQEARSAVNASAILASSEQYNNIEEAVKDCTLVVGTTSLGHRDLQLPLHRLEMAGRLISEAAVNGRVALMFGSEKFGMSNREMAYCHWLTRIPTREEHQSMNLGQAVSICLYELIRSDEAVFREPEPLTPATAEELHRFTELLLEATRESGFMNPKTAESTEAKIRRMVNRLAIPARDVVTWQGILRQVLWKVRGA